MRVELYKFVEGSQSWTLTSGTDEVIYESETYEPATLGRSEIEAKAELPRANVEIKFDLDNAVARRWMTERVEAVVTLTIFEQEDGETNAVWKGRLASVKPGVSDLSLVFESIFTSLRRPGLRARYTRSCRHSLYGRGCFLVKSGFAVPGTVGTVSGTTVVVAAAAGYSDGHFSIGMLQAPDGTLRFIQSHTGDTLTLIRPLPGLEASDSVILYPGCDRTRQTCQSKFNNLLNYGGYDWIPTRNPFDGSSIV